MEDKDSNGADKIQDPNEIDGIPKGIASAINDDGLSNTDEEKKCQKITSQVWAKRIQTFPRARTRANEEAPTLNPN